jgi:hypothetical protein
MNSIKKTARTAGVLYLLIAFIAPFSMLYVPSHLVVPADAAATVKNITASEGLFRLGMASDALVFLVEIVLTVLLYVLLKPVHKTLSLVAAFSRLAMTIIQGVNLVNSFFVLLLVGGGAYLTVFAPLRALVLLFLNAHQYVALIWCMFFGLHLVFLGTLVYKSNYIPAFLGILLMVAAFCYLVQSFGTLLLPQYAAVFTQIALLSIVEIAFPLWLVIKGVSIDGLKKWGF